MLETEIKNFCTNLCTNRKTHNTLGIGYKDTIKKQTVTIPKRAMREKGIYPNSLGVTECKNYDYIISLNIKHESKLMYDKKMNKFYLYVMMDRKKINPKNRKEIVALDPGEKTFMTYYSVNEHGKFGDNMRDRILHLQGRIKKLSSAVSKSKNSKGGKLKNKCRVKKQIQNYYNLIKGYVNEVHKKTARYLCMNYENIYLPEFKTKPMICNGKIKAEYKRIKELPRAEGRVETRALKRKVRLSGKVKFVLSQTITLPI